MAGDCQSTTDELQPPAQRPLRIRMDSFYSDASTCNWVALPVTLRASHGRGPGSHIVFIYGCSRPQESKTLLPPQLRAPQLPPTLHRQHLGDVPLHAPQPAAEGSRAGGSHSVMASSVSFSCCTRAYRQIHHKQSHTFTPTIGTHGYNGRVKTKPEPSTWVRLSTKW